MSNFIAIFFFCFILRCLDTLFAIPSQPNILCNKNRNVCCRSHSASDADYAEMPKNNKNKLLQAGKMSNTHCNQLLTHNSQRSLEFRFDRFHAHFLFSSVSTSSMRRFCIGAYLYESLNYFEWEIWDTTCRSMLTCTNIIRSSMVRQWTSFCSAQAIQRRRDHIFSSRTKRICF